MHDWAFLARAGHVPAVNALLLAPLLLRAGLVPRIIPILGLIGAPLLLAAAVGILRRHRPGLGGWLPVRGADRRMGDRAGLLAAAQGVQHRCRGAALRPGADGRTRRCTLIT